MTYSCEAAAILSEAGDTEIQSAHSYGRNIGIAFQLVDDLLDFVSSAGTCQTSRHVIDIYLLICKNSIDARIETTVLFDWCCRPTGEAGRR